MNWKTFSQEKPSLEQMVLIYVPESESFEIIAFCTDMQEFINQAGNQELYWLELPKLPQLNLKDFCACPDCDEVDKK